MARITKPKTQPNASGPFWEAYQRYCTIGAAHADDAALMAGVCADTLQILAGAVSPQLVWEGAQKHGMTTRELLDLAEGNPEAVSDLMWGTPPPKPRQKGRPARHAPAVPAQPPRRKPPTDRTVPDVS